MGRVRVIGEPGRKLPHVKVGRNGDLVFLIDGDPGHCAMVSNELAGRSERDDGPRHAQPGRSWLKPWRRPERKPLPTKATMSVRANTRYAPTAPLPVV